VLRTVPFVLDLQLRIQERLALQVHQAPTPEAVSTSMRPFRPVLQHLAVAPCREDVTGVGGPGARGMKSMARPVALDCFRGCEAPGNLRLNRYGSTTNLQDLVRILTTMPQSAAAENYYSLGNSLFIKKLVSGLVLGASILTCSAISSPATAAERPWPPGPSTSPAAPFTDVHEGDVFFTEIDWLRLRGITDGFPDGTYRPTQPMNRDAVAAFFYRQHAGPSYVAPAVSPFSDVSTDNQFYTEIAWFASTGLTTGYPDGTFHPTEPVQRDAMAAYIFRENQIFVGPQQVQSPTTPTFTDVQPGSMFYKEIEWAADAGITGGYTDGTFRPLAPIARDAVAAFMWRFADYL
jgi:S-layer homology domain